MGGGATLGWALQHYQQSVGELLRVKERESEAAEGGWVCPLQHHCTNRHGKGRKQEGVKEGGRRQEMKWFNLGWVLKSFRERVVKEKKNGKMLQPCIVCCSFFKWINVEPAARSRHRDLLGGRGDLVLVSHRDPSVQTLSLIPAPPAHTSRGLNLFTKVNVSHWGVLIHHTWKIFKKLWCSEPKTSEKHHHQQCRKVMWRQRGNVFCLLSL